MGFYINSDRRELRRIRVNLSIYLARWRSKVEKLCIKVPKSSLWVLSRQAFKWRWINLTKSAKRRPVIIILRDKQKIRFSGWRRSTSHSVVGSAISLLSKINCYFSIFSQDSHLIISSISGNSNCWLSLIFLYLVIFVMEEICLSGGLLWSTQLPVHPFGFALIINNRTQSGFSNSKNAFSTGWRSVAAVDRNLDPGCQWWYQSLLSLPVAHPSFVSAKAGFSSVS